MSGKYTARTRHAPDDPHYTPSLSTGQTWNTAAYAQNGRFVATMATAVVDLLNPQPNEHILDIGCGDGALTAQLAASGALLTGVDASEAMVQAARARGLQVDHSPAKSLPYQSRFDAAFSNAALHWIPAEDQPASLAAIFRALRPGARFVAEMGGQGNIAAIRTALSAVLAPHGLDSEALAASFFPSAARYRSLLEQAGFTVHQIDLYPRPTPLPGGPEGMTLWLQTFRNGVLDQIPEPTRTESLTQTVALLKPILHDPTTNSWTADYVRLRFQATRP
jgi:trans-aconitate methyltransferase